MRLKLVLLASFAAAITGSGATIAIVYAYYSSLRPVGSPDLIVLATFILPLATSALAAIFVYRHTARRRRLQAFLTATLSVVLSVTALIAASILTAQLEPLHPEPSPERPLVS